ncbi:IclR family transcriptional regulator [Streptomyces eurythermus]|uniref:IclR family transcriptional regulator n=1 Tax=Streptomyces eurythermus TaxID=42237 RepID=UPI0036948F19
MIDRVVSIFDVLEQTDGLTLSQVVRRTGLPRSSAHRILEQLVGARLLRRDDNGYRLGMRIMELGSVMYHQDRVRAAAVHHLHQLHACTGLAAQLAVLDEGKVVYLVQVGGRSGISSRSLVNGRPQALRTVVGKALLAHSPATCCEPAAAHHRLRAELADIRERGVAYGHEETMPGVGCVAAPVIGAGDTASFAAVSVSGPLDHMRFPELAAVVRRTAANVRRGAADSGDGPAAP